MSADATLKPKLVRDHDRRHDLKGKSVTERAKALITLAHPDFREELERQAHENRLIPRGVFIG